MKAVRRCNATGAFSWIGSDGWSARSLVSDGNEPEMEGTLSVQPQANPVEGFEDYFLNLTVENNRRNPWFVGESISFNNTTQGELRVHIAKIAKVDWVSLSRGWGGGGAKTHSP